MTAANGAQWRAATGWLPLSLRLALRDLRGGLAGFSIFLICIALGTGAIGAIHSLSASLQATLLRDGRTLLGADVEASLMHRQASAEEMGLFSRFGEVSEVASLRAMARLPEAGRQVLIDLKAVDGHYPLYGAVTLEGGASLDDAIRRSDGVAVDPALLNALKVNVGDAITIGKGRFTITATIFHEPDRLAAGPAFGPRVLLSRQALQKTGLIEPGSLVRWMYRIKGEVSETRLREQSGARLAEGGFQVRDSNDPAPALSSTIRRLTEFLTLVGIAALLTGGIGVANAISSFVERRRDTIATFKILGARQALITKTFVTEIAVLTALSLALGLAVAVGAPLLAARFLRGLLPVEIEPGAAPGALAIACLFGALTALPFILWPLGRAKQVRPAELFRQGVENGARFPPLSYRLASILAVAALVVATILLALDKRVAMIACAALLAIFGIFWMLGLGLRRLARAIGRPKRPELALALSNIAGPASLSQTMALSLGAGLTLLTAVSLIDGALTQELQSRIPQTAPSHFFIGIAKQELGQFESLIAREAPQASLALAPMLRGRLTALKGIPSEDYKVPANAAWVLHGDRGLTYAQTIPPGSTLVEGEWWPKDYNGPPLVSFEAELARNLGLKLGDEVTVNVLGRNVTAKIANLRKVNWTSFNITFVMVFSPNALAGAPFTYLGTLSWPKDDATGPAPAREQRVVSALAEAFPAVSAISVRDALDAFNRIFEKVMYAVRVAGSVTLIMGVLVIAGALLTAQRRRVLEAVILRTLGASRRRIVLAHLFEYLLLALAISAVAAVFGALTAYLIVSQVMNVGFSVSPITLLQPSAIETILVLALGAAGTYRVLSVKPAHYLRVE